MWDDLCFKSDASGKYTEIYFKITSFEFIPIDIFETVT